MALNTFLPPKNNEFKSHLFEIRYMSEKEELSDEIKMLMDIDIIRDIANRTMHINPDMPYDLASLTARNVYFGEPITGIELPLIEEEEEPIISSEEIIDENVEKELDELFSSDNMVDNSKPTEFDLESIEEPITEEGMNDLISEPVLPEETITEEGINNLISEPVISEERMEDLINEPIISEEVMDDLISEPVLPEEPTEEIIKEEKNEEPLSMLDDNVEVSKENLGESLIEEPIVGETDLLDDINNELTGLDNLDLLNNLPEEKLESPSEELELPDAKEELKLPENNEELNLFNNDITESLEENIEELETKEEEHKEETLSNTLTNGLSMDFLDEPVLQKVKTR